MPLINENLKESILKLLKTLEEISRLKQTVVFLTQGIVHQLEPGIYSLENYIFEVTITENGKKIINQLDVKELMINNQINP
jgi:hypothetical protein